MDPSLYKDTTVSRGFTYHYFHCPATPDKPTLLFLHGFPSSSYDWRRQVAYFRPKGYGVLVPDIIGAGGTSKPDSADAFRFSLIARDIVDVLDTEGLRTVVGIGHDWGSAVLSRLANLYSERFHAFAWLALSYVPPVWQTSGLANEDAKNTQFGYWEYMSRDNAYEMCEKNLDSFLQLAYPENPDLWHESLSPLGKTQAWIEANRKPGLPEWLPQEEYNVARDILAKAGLKSPLNWYKAMVSGANTQDEQSIPEEAHRIQKPVLFIAAARDSVCTAAGGKTVMAQYARHATIVELNVGHWPQLEETERVNLELEKWLDTLNLGEL